MAVVTRPASTNPTNELTLSANTKQHSMLMVKKLVAITISNITYIRAIFPESSFADKLLKGGVKLKILREDSNCPRSNGIVKWIRGCFEAIDKNYLRKITVGVFSNPEKPETLIESYSITISYQGDITSIKLERNNSRLTSLTSNEMINKSAVSLIRTLILLTESLDPLPSTARLLMKLLYYDDVTPADYEPPGFIPSNLPTFSFDEEVATVRLGQVTSNYHNFDFKARCPKRYFDEEEIEDNLNVNKRSKSDNEVDEIHSDLVDMNGSCHPTPEKLNIPSAVESPSTSKKSCSPISTLAASTSYEIPEARTEVDSNSTSKMQDLRIAAIRDNAPVVSNNGNQKRILSTDKVSTNFDFETASAQSSQDVHSKRRKSSMCILSPEY